MNEFTASNGVTFERTNAGKTLLLTSPGDSWPNPEEHSLLLNADFEPALREFFRAEEDERLGRWRWADNPDYVVYRQRNGDVTVVDESDITKFPDRISRRYCEDPIGSLGWGEFAARAFFDAHPEPKPWHNAKPGELWALTSGGVENVFKVYTDDPIFQPVFGMGFDNEPFTAGRRIWPVES